MPIDTFFETSEDERAGAIKELTMMLPADQREAATQRANQIIRNYQGRDSDAIAVLINASGLGRFDEFATKLERHYQDSLKYLNPQIRRTFVEGGSRADHFITDCYKEMGIEPQVQVG